MDGISPAVEEDRVSDSRPAIIRRAKPDGRLCTLWIVVKRPDLVQSVDHEPSEVEAQAALDRTARERLAMSAREFVSERDALEDAWAGSGEHSARDEGW